MSIYICINKFVLYGVLYRVISEKTDIDINFIIYMAVHLSGLAHAFQ